MSSSRNTVSNSTLHAIADMGSNGIRFSIHDLAEPEGRLLSTLYASRAPISLYDAQFAVDALPGSEKQPIPDNTIEAVLTALHRFQRTCKSFDVPRSNIKLLATEATRTAVNGDKFRARIKADTKLDVTLLAKEEEGRLGAMGAVSGFSMHHFVGKGALVMDMGGGSVQITHVKGPDKNGFSNDHVGSPVSLPFGAAALKRLLDNADHLGDEKVKELHEELKTQLGQAYDSLNISANSHLPLYLSGGGFRGWGYVLLSKHNISPYPIPTMNGFRTTWADFTSTASVKQHVLTHENIFRVSNRRAIQVPAVAFLIDALQDALPKGLVDDVFFCEGGTRQGEIFDMLSSDLRMEVPMNVATARYARPDTKTILGLLKAAYPNGSCPQIVQDVLQGFANLFYHHRPFPRETQPSAALRETTSGLLAGVHGLTHTERAALGLLLCERWGAELSPADETHYESLRLLLGPEAAWWTRYLGRVASLVGDVYPGGVGEKVMDLSISGATEKGESFVLVANFVTQAELDENIRAVDWIRKVRKRKSWAVGRESWGMKIGVAAQVMH